MTKLPRVLSFAMPSRLAFISQKRLIFYLSIKFLAKFIYCTENFSNFAVRSHSRYLMSILLISNYKVAKNIADYQLFIQLF